MKVISSIKYVVVMIMNAWVITTLAQNTQSEHPNILFILLDDARYDMFAPNGGPSFMQTPAINRIANEGVNFKYVGATTSLCCPSRSSFYTGLYSHHHGAVDNGTSPKHGLIYISTILQSAGYYTGFVGKWLLSKSLPDTPIGFDYWATTETFTHTNPKVTFNDGSNVTYDGHEAVIYTDLGVDFLSNKVPSDKPWALFVFLRVPHTPYQPLPSEDTLYQHASITFPDNFSQYAKNFPSYLYPAHEYAKDSINLDQDLRDYYETCHAAEYSVDSFLSYLEASHILDNTMVIFSSDNGFLQGEHDLVAKELSYNESMRIPLFIRYPAWFAPGTIVDSDWAANIDIAPTLVELTGIADTFHMDGISLHKLALGQDHRKDFFYEFYPNDSIAWEAVRSERYEYIYSYCSNISEEFYDLDSDQKENNNLIFDTQYSLLIQEFRSKRDSFRLATGDTINPLSKNCSIQSKFYQDADLDGFGNATVIIKASVAPSGYVYDSTDCNDANTTIHPGVVEICNSVDDNCNGQIDENIQRRFYADADGDRFGDKKVSVLVFACSPPSNFVLDSTDCNDSNPTINPSATDITNGLDDNCNGLIDEGPIFYADTDGDLFGNKTIFIISASPPPGYVADRTDCNDANASTHPGAIEACNQIDDNCNGLIDEGTTTTFYRDNDGDGYGRTVSTLQACMAPSGYVTNNVDCNDANAGIHPGAPDICNSADDNCNGVIDENAIVAIISPGGSVNICSGTSITLSANYGAGITYQWLKNNLNISGATDQIYSANKAGTYKVKESNSFNCNSTSAGTILKLTKIPSATITPLGNLDICQTGSVALQANSGSGYSYQWQKKGTTISGATNQTYTATRAATYKVIVTNSGCSKTSKGTKVTKSCREENAADDKLHSSDLSIYPNPASGKCFIDLKLPGEIPLTNDMENQTAILELRDIFGRTILTKNISIENGEALQEISFNTAMPSGIYLIRIITKADIYSRPVVVQR